MALPANNEPTAWSLVDELLGLSTQELTSRLAELPDSRRSEVEELLASARQGAAHALTAPPVRLPVAFTTDLIGPYLLQEELAQGGTASVFRAVRADKLHANPLAVKVVHFASLREKEQLFRQEIRILARLDHRGIVRLIDGGVTTNGLFYLVTEFVEGLPLHHSIREKTLSLRRRIELMAEIGAAVAYAHQRGVVHRDLKPSNIIVSPDGRPKLLDFGIARFKEESDGEAMATVLTRMTTEYASPEQKQRERPLTEATDIYSLGVILHELLLGSRPASPPLHRGEEPPPHRIRGLDPDLEAILQKALAFRKEDRYRNAGEFEAELRAWLQGTPVQARRLGWLSRSWRYARRHHRRVLLPAGALALGALAVGSWWKSNHERQLALVRVQQLPLLGPFRQLETLEHHLRLHLDVVSKAETLNGRLPGLIRRKADIYTRAAEIVGFPGIASFGDVEYASRLYKQAVALIERAETDGVEPASLWPHSCIAREGLGVTLLELGDTEEAERFLRQAVEVTQQVEARGFIPGDLLGQRRDAMLQLSRVHVRRHDHQRALTLRRQALEIARAEQPPLGRPLTMAAVLAPYAWSQRACGDPRGALASYREAEGIIRAYRNEPDRDESTLDWLARNLYEQGRTLEQLGRWREAREALEESVARLDALLEQAPASGERRRWLALSEAHLASVRARLGQRDRRTSLLANSARAHMREVRVQAEGNVYVQEELREIEDLLAKVDAR